MARITANINDGGLRQQLAEAISRGRNLTPVLQDIRERLLFSVRQNFQQGGRPTRWRPSRRVREEGGQTLVDTARLRNSMTGRIEGNHSVIVGTNVAYGRKHQFGDRATNLPARPFLVIQPSDITYSEGALRDYLEEPLRG